MFTNQPRLDFNKPLDWIKQEIAKDVAKLQEFGERDAELDYLYFLRDDINRQIKLAKKAKKEK